MQQTCGKRFRKSDNTPEHKKKISRCSNAESVGNSLIQTFTGDQKSDFYGDNSHMMTSTICYDNHSFLEENGASTVFEAPSPESECVPQQPQPKNIHDSICVPRSPQQLITHDSPHTTVYSDSGSIANIRDLTSPFSPTCRKRSSREPFTTLIQEKNSVDEVFHPPKLLRVSPKPKNLEYPFSGSDNVDVCGQSNPCQQSNIFVPSIGDTLLDQTSQNPNISISSSQSSTVSTTVPVTLASPAGSSLCFSSPMHYVTSGNVTPAPMTANCSQIVLYRPVDPLANITAQASSFLPYSLSPIRNVAKQFTFHLLTDHNSDQIPTDSQKNNTSIVPYIPVTPYGQATTR